MLIRPLPRRQAIVGDLRISRRRAAPRRLNVATIAPPPTPPGPELPVSLLSRRFKRALRSRMRV